MVIELLFFFLKIVLVLLLLLSFSFQLQLDVLQLFVKGMPDTGPLFPKLFGCVLLNGADLLYNFVIVIVDLFDILLVNLLLILHFEAFLSLHHFDHLFLIGVHAHEQ
jgi:hypothetical protein